MERKNIRLSKGRIPSRFLHFDGQSLRLAAGHSEDTHPESGRYACHLGADVPKPTDGQGLACKFRKLSVYPAEIGR